MGSYASTVSGDIDKINTEFDKNYSQLIARGATVDDPIGILFGAYQVVPCFNFKTYINRMHEDYLDSKLPTLTHASLIGMAKSKFNYLRNKGTWGAKSIDDDKIVAMTAVIKELKGQLKCRLSWPPRQKRETKRRRVRKTRTKRIKAIESSRRRTKPGRSSAKGWGKARKEA